MHIIKSKLEELFKIITLKHQDDGRNYVGLNDIEKNFNQLASKFNGAPTDFFSILKGCDAIIMLSIDYDKIKFRKRWKKYDILS